MFALFVCWQNDENISEVIWNVRTTQEKYSVSMCYANVLQPRNPLWEIPSISH